LPDGIFFKPKIPIWVIFYELALEGVGIFYSHLVYLQTFGVIYAHLVYYWLFCTFSPVLVSISEKNLATLLWTLTTGGPNMAQGFGSMGKHPLQT
jgi:hypothetical protein